MICKRGHENGYYHRPDGKRVYCRRCAALLRGTPERLLRRRIRDKEVREALPKPPTGTYIDRLALMMVRRALRRVQRTCHDCHQRCHLDEISFQPRSGRFRPICLFCVERRTPLESYEPISEMVA